MNGIVNRALGHVTAEHMRDWAEIMQIEFVHITTDSSVNDLKQQLMMNEVYWKFMG